MSFKNYLKFYLKIMPLITIIILSLVTQGALYGEENTSNQRIFFEAVKKGDIAQTKKSLEVQLADNENTTHVADSIKDKTDYNKTALMYAVSNRDIEMINLLLSYSAQVDAESAKIIGHPLKTITPFTLAIYNDDLAIVELFSDFLYKKSRGADPHYPYQTHSNPNLKKLQEVYNFAKQLGKLDIVKYFDDSGYFITEKDKQIGELTEQKINRYKKKWGTISQSDFDRAVSSGDISDIRYNKSYILYLKKCADINFTIYHIDKILQTTYPRHLIRSQYKIIRFIMDTYNISADVPELAIINIIRDNFSSSYEKLLNMLFERGFNPNLITLGKPNDFFGIPIGYDTDFERYVHNQQITYNRNQRAKEKELRKAELKAQKEAEKAVKLAEKEAKKANKLAEKEAKKANKLAEKEIKKLAKEAKLAEKEIKRLEREVKKAAK